MITNTLQTVVNWRKTVVDHLDSMAHESLNSPAASIPTSVRMVIDDVSWPDFAQKWRRSYYEFTRNYDPATMKFKTIDEHHLESLYKLIEEHRLEGLWTDDQISDIASIWHKLDPWPVSRSSVRDTHWI